MRSQRSCCKRGGPAQKKPHHLLRRKKKEDFPFFVSVFLLSFFLSFLVAAAAPPVLKWEGHSQLQLQLQLQQISRKEERNETLIYRQTLVSLGGMHARTHGQTDRQLGQLKRKKRRKKNETRGDKCFLWEKAETGKSFSQLLHKNWGRSSLELEGAHFVSTRRSLKRFRKGFRCCFEQYGVSESMFLCFSNFLPKAQELIDWPQRELRCKMIRISHSDSI